MKKIIIIVLLFAISKVFAQGLPGGQYDRYEEEIIKTNKDPKAFLSLNYKHIVSDEFEMNDVGLKVGIFATDNLMIGLNYFYLFDQSIIFSPEVEGEGAALRFDYYGLNTHYFLTSNSTIPISIGLGLGFGQMTFTNFLGAPANRDLTGDWVTVMEPEVNFYYYIVPRVVANMNFGYRIINGVEYNGIEDKDLSGFLGGIGFGIVLY